MTASSKKAGPVQESAVIPQPKWFIHLIDSNKGGVGKSMTARTMYHLFQELGIPSMGIEADVDLSGEELWDCPTVRCPRLSEQSQCCL